MKSEELIRLLPPMLSGNALYDALSYLPEYDPSCREKDNATRLLALSEMYSIYVPNKMSAEIYNKLYISLLHSLEKKGSQLAIRQYAENYKAIKSKSYAGIMGGTDSFTIIGTSGIGKSSAISKAISLINQGGIISSTSSFQRIIPCLVVQCPFDSSIKGLLLEILRKVDEVLNTGYYNNALRARSTTDMLIGSVSQVALNHLGVLVVDEIQNVVTSKHGSQLVGVLTQLINNSSISIAMVGTPQSDIFFSQAMQLARRSLGLHYDALPFDEDFFKLCQVLYSYQYTKYTSELTDYIVSWLYEHTAGITSVLVTLIHDAQELAILDGSEELNIEYLTRAYNERLALLHTYIHPNEVASPITTAKRKSPRFARGNIGEDQIISDFDIRKLSAIAKANGLNVLDMIKKYVPVIEVQL